MASTPIERSGIVQDEATGQLYIPGSRRPDGTWRKPRRVKDGYVPQEEVPVYESKAAQFQKSKPSLPPGLSPDMAAQASNRKVPVGMPAEQMSKTAKRNAQRKEKKKQNQPHPENDSGSLPVQNIAEQLARAQLSSNKSGESAGDKSEHLKQVRKLRKKLKQIEELERRIASGDIKEPDKDQMEKMAKKQAIVEEMEQLQAEMDD
ncbi:partner of Y14 and mago-like isoform X2 [Dreissena polymorpha]|uniref:WIBG Mago-binding domain-containing protein n=1 Tax=Dreissena polymorpha TaxID=45954 RepID=A0A9D3Y322_DREPO|nr:partner of Y14 and mago-like isoform X2 [Dreissena polymorpha]KAH3691412.1 hypothetical protein DPMN_194046 [Dreissena polymorpha]